MGLVINLKMELLKQEKIFFLSFFFLMLDFPGAEFRVKENNKEIKCFLGLL